MSWGQTRLLWSEATFFFFLSVSSVALCNTLQLQSCLWVSSGNKRLGKHFEWMLINTLCLNQHPDISIFKKLSYLAKLSPSHKGPFGTRVSLFLLFFNLYLFRTGLLRGCLSFSGTPWSHSLMEAAQHNHSLICRLTSCFTGVMAQLKDTSMDLGEGEGGWTSKLLATSFVSLTFLGNHCSGRNEHRQHSGLNFTPKPKTNPADTFKFIGIKPLEVSQHTYHNHNIKTEEWQNKQNKNVSIQKHTGRKQTNKKNKTHRFELTLNGR